MGPSGSLPYEWFPWATASLGLLGSLHCAGMCGGIAALVADRGGTMRYHLGRLLSYGALGALAGLAGQSTLSALTGHARAAAVAVLALIVLAAMLLRLVGAGRGLGRRSALTLGLASGLLPCGWLYGFLVLAASTGSPWSGALTLFILAVTSIPALAVTPALLVRLRTRFPRLQPVATTLVTIASLSNVAIHAYALTDRGQSLHQHHQSPDSRPVGADHSAGHRHSGSH